MSTKTSPPGYTRLQIALHWLVAALVVMQLVFTDGVEAAWSQRMGAPVEGNPALHIIGGSLILILAAWRVILRIRHGAPAHPEGQPALVTVLANIVQWAFYALLFILPLTGLVGWFGGVGPAIRAHTLIQSAFLPLIGLHIAGALVQQFYFRSGVLSRMTRTAR